jgi:hypothetical protein
MTKELTVKNLYGIRGEITHRTDANVLVVTGENGAGKSSFTQPFLHLLAHKVVKGAPDAVHEGAIEGEVKFTDFDRGISLARRFKSGKMLGVEIRALDGAKYADSPAAMLKTLIGTVTVDVSDFLSADESTRRDLIMSKATFPDGFDLAALNAKQASIEGSRTDANRERARLEGVMSGLVPPAKNTPDEEVSATDLLDQLTAAREHNSAIAAAARTADAMQEDVDRLERDIERMREAIRQNEAAQEAIELRRADVVALAAEDTIDTEPIAQQLADVEATNRAVRERATFEKTKADHDAAVAQHKAWDAKLTKVKAEKFEGLADAVFPHPSLSVDDEYVLIDGQPFARCNSAAKALVALAVAMSGDHGDEELRVVILKEGDWLDAKSLAAADKLIADAGFFGLVDRGRPDLPDVPGIDIIALTDGQVAK